MKFTFGFLTFLSAIATLSGAATAEARTVLFERLGAPSPKWLEVGATHGDEQIDFKVALTQQNTKELDARFWELSDPSSESYGQWMSSDEIRTLVSPPEEDHNAVVDWLKQHGIVDVQSKGDALYCTAPAAHVNKAFQTSMRRYHREAHGVEHKVDAHVGEMSIPDELANKIDFVIGLGRFPNTEPRFQAGNAARHEAAHAAANTQLNFNGLRGLDGELQAPNATPDPKQTRSPLIVVPETLKNLYNVNYHEPSNQSGNSISILEFSQGTPSGFSQKNLAVFNQAVGFNYTKIAQVSHRGPFDATSTEGEFTLDPEYVQSLNPLTPVVYETQASGWVFDWVSELNARAHNSQVLSLSAGWSENDQCQLTPKSCSQLGVNSKQYVDRTNKEFAKLGVAGISVLVSAGDSGAAGRTNWFCIQTPDHPVHATFPADSPYVTAIGGTQLDGDAVAMAAGEGPAICKANAGKCAKSGTEVVWGGKAAGGATGGGFSDYIQQPTYQRDAVAAWMASDGLRPASGHFNPKGRAFPDISAQAINILYYQGKFSGGGGTSFAAPIIAGLIGRLNAERMAAGKSTLGHLNPLLYKMGAEQPSCFNDVTIGDNRASERSFCAEGYGATKGYDPVTGWGTPNFENMSKYIAKLN